MNVLFRSGRSANARPAVDRVGRYRLGTVISAGGSGTVYAASDPTLNRPVAVKIPHRATLLDRRVLARFEREARLAASIRHPNVVSILDFGIQDGTPYLVMPLLNGIDLASVGRRMPASLVVEFGSALARALEVIHRTGILHRDIKPSNVMIVDGTPILVDFGLAKSFHDVDVTEATMSPGTPRYMSPEQLAGRELDPRSDVYSLAVTLAELLHGRRPTHPATVKRDTGSRTASRKPTLDLVLELAMATSRSKRPKTALDFAHRIEGCANRT